MKLEPHHPGGYHVESWGGDRFTSVAWFRRLHEAEAELARLVLRGHWAGRPPRIQYRRII